MKSERDLELYKKIIEQELLGYPKGVSSGELQMAARYMLSLGGKRLRPVLTLAACRLSGGKWEEALPAALAVELFHNFTLIHDDIMDQAPIRRGKPAVHAKFGINTAILAGDLMMVEAYRCLEDVPPARSRDILEAFSHTAAMVCVGQQTDLEFEGRMDVSISDYLDMIEKKTSVLLGCSLQLGSLSAGADKKISDGLYRFGKAIGMAFQLQDDLLDAFGSQGKVGKQAGGDILMNKKTYLFVKAMEIAGHAERGELLQWYSGDRSADGKLEAVKKIYRKLGLEEAARQEKERYYEKALENLSSTGLQLSTTLVLQEMADALMTREG